ncbi:Crp/Fnr family transcriptional regulator [Cohnella silvisoli]|uniref:Cyclic nucleotide-binding domain-containing protein n=1 Tax=Cohnella silvisoli TaxID=2873699 RepID=A0ABV1L108_9BACL|nr:helix-turn-helix domain-containing protein [Cohnella silvisoli]MCD9025244.1 cyclic nucleotide-binding domain-containing protein [Cohnella silvisoli]
MKEFQDREQLNHYLHTHRLESIFNEPLLPYLSLYVFDQGELISSQGGLSEYLYVLVKGNIKVYNTSAEGRTLVISFKTPLEVIGEIEYIRGIDFINTVEAVSSVCMIGVHYRWLKKYGSDHSPLLQFLLEIITRKFFIKSNSLSFNLMYPVEVRLASYLLSVSQLSTSSLTDAANLIGTSYRHLNRVIHKFCIDGLIERNKEFIVVTDRERLIALAGHDNQIGK